MRSRHLKTTIVLVYMGFLCHSILYTKAQNKGRCTNPEYIYSPKSQTCLYFNLTERDWYEAGQFCQGLAARGQSYLVRITNQEMNEFMKNINPYIKTTTRFWTGAYFEPSGYNLIWGNNAADMAWNNFKFADINKYIAQIGNNGLAYCGVYVYEAPKGSWEFHLCEQSTTFPTICEIGHSLCRFRFTYFASSHTCIGVINEKNNEAFDFCGGAFEDTWRITIETPEKNDFIKDCIKPLPIDQTIQSNTFWIGLNDKDVEQKFVWHQDGREATYLNLNSSQTLQYQVSRDCFTVTYPGENKAMNWNAQDCSDQYGSICEALTEKERICLKPFYSWDCKKPCPRNCAGDGKCTRTNATCLHGCLTGYYENTCDTACDQNNYGMKCANPCSPGCAGEDQTCDHINGTCRFGCDPGVFGTYCENDCPMGKWGVDCAGECSPNCGGVQAFCNRVNGHCILGCKRGWKEPLCVIEKPEEGCPNKTYGERCFECSPHCAGDGDCDEDDGHCLSGCKEGYRPPLCRLTTIKEVSQARQGFNMALLWVLVLFTINACVFLLGVLLSQQEHIRPPKFDTDHQTENSMEDDDDDEDDEDDEIEWEDEP